MKRATAVVLLSAAMLAMGAPSLLAATPVTVHNPWLVNDRVADTHNLASMAATYVNAYSPSGVVAPASDEAKAINIYNNQKRRLYHWADEPPPPPPAVVSTTRLTTRMSSAGRCAVAMPARPVRLPVPPVSVSGRSRYPATGNTNSTTAASGTCSTR